MKITIFTGGLSGGGAERVACNMATYYYNKGHDVEFLTIGDNENSYYYNPQINRVCLLKLDERSSFVANIIKRLFRLIKYLISKKKDVYIVSLPDSIIILLSLRFLTKSKIVASERGDPQKLPSFQQKLLRLLCKQADGWVFQTQDVKNWYKSHLGDSNNIIIPNAINPDFIQPIYHGVRKKTIVTAGRYKKQKNQRLLIDAFSKISDRYSDYRLIIYGEGPLNDELAAHITYLGLDKKVILGGYINNIGEKIKDASLFVLSSDYEGMPNALMEAMALGLPCVSTDCDGGGARFLIENEKNGLLVPKDDVNALAVAMKRMLADREFAELCGKEAHKICERLAPDKVYGMWEEFIQDIIGNT